MNRSTARLRELGAGLRQLRDSCGMSGQEMAARMGCDPSTLSRLENGKRVPTTSEIVKYTTLCGFVGDEQDDLVRLAQEPDDYRFVRHDGRLPDRLRPLIFHESTAREIESFHPIHVPAILQTPDYARAIFEAQEFDPGEIDDHVRARTARHEALTRVDPVQCAFYIHENALRVPVGETGVMHGQLLHLLFVGTRPQCDVRVVPASAGGSGMARGAFDIFSCPGGMPLIYLEHLTTSLFIEAAPDLRVYRTTLDRLAKVALDETESRFFINRLATEYKP